MVKSRKKGARVQTRRAVGRAPVNLGGGRGPVAMKIVDVIRQNPILARMEALWNMASSRRRKAMLDQHLALRRLDYAGRVRGFVALGQKYGTLRNEADVRHAAKDWLGGYFEGPVVDILIHGFIVTMKRSIKTGLPVGMYWVAGPGREVKTAIAESEHQITFLLVTPPAPAIETPVRVLRRKDPLWVVSGTRRGVKIEQVTMTALRED
jgi:hypothetical protein